MGCPARRSLCTRPRGAAVLMALIVVALVTAAASAILNRMSVWTRQTELVEDATRARLALTAGVAFASTVLRDDEARSTVDFLGEPWATRLPATEVEGAEMAGQLYDQQGLFNLNNIVRGGEVDAAGFAKFTKLLDILNLPEELAESLVDWLDADSDRTGRKGAEDDDYRDANPPRRAGNRLLADANELLQIRGFTPEVVAKLRPFVAALPGITAINVNTAPAEVLALAVDGLTLGEARVLAAERDRAYFKDLADFRARLPRKDLTVVQNWVSVTSQYFLLRAATRYGRARVFAQVMLHRAPQKFPVVVWQRLE